LDAFFSGFRRFLCPRPTFGLSARSFCAILSSFFFTWPFPPNFLLQESPYAFPMPFRTCFYLPGLSAAPCLPPTRSASFWPSLSARRSLPHAFFFPKVSDSPVPLFLTGPPFSLPGPLVIFCPRILQESQSVLLEISGPRHRFDHPWFPQLFWRVFLLRGTLGLKVLRWLAWCSFSPSVDVFSRRRPFSSLRPNSPLQSLRVIFSGPEHCFDPPLPR